MKETCAHCVGTGEVPNGIFAPETVYCDACCGTGWTPAPLTDAALTAWALRHNISVGITELRAMVDDARSIGFV